MSFNLPYLTLSYVSEVADKRRFADIVSGFYEIKASGYIGKRRETMENISERVRTCSAAWFFDHYKGAEIYDLKSVNLCKNKFCPNCQKLIQAKRLYTYTPVLDELAKRYGMWHVVLTLPNCNGKKLSSVIDKMFVGFSKLIRYFKGAAKIAGYDFAKYGYVGAVRALEVTNNYTTDSYHPHLHCIFALRPDFEPEKKHINEYSYHKGVLCRKFSDFELELQKVWYLLMTGKAVKGETLSGVETGYSCIADRIGEREYYEVFKYATKLWSEDKYVINYDCFCVLYSVLYRRRTIQGYGAMYGISCSDELDDENSAEYDEFIAELMRHEKPELTSYYINSLQKELHVGNKRFITRRNVHRGIAEIRPFDYAPIVGHEIVNDIEDNETIYIPEEISEELKRINNAEKIRKKVMSIADII